MSINIELNEKEMLILSNALNNISLKPYEINDYLSLVEKINNCLKEQ